MGIISKWKANRKRNRVVKSIADEAEYREDIKQAPIVGRARARIKAKGFIKTAREGKKSGGSGGGAKIISYMGDVAHNFNNPGSSQRAEPRTPKTKKVISYRKVKGKKKRIRVVRRVRAEPREQPREDSSPVQINYDKIFG